MVSGAVLVLVGVGWVQFDCFQPRQLTLNDKTEACHSANTELALICSVNHHFQGYNHLVQAVYQGH